MAHGGGGGGGHGGGGHGGGHSGGSRGLLRGRGGRGRGPNNQNTPAYPGRPNVPGSPNRPNPNPTSFGYGRDRWYNQGFTGTRHSLGGRVLALIASVVVLIIVVAVIALVSTHHSSSSGSSSASIRPAAISHPTSQSSDPSTPWGVAELSSPLTVLYGGSGDHTISTVKLTVRSLVAWECDGCGSGSFSVFGVTDGGSRVSQTIDAKTGGEFPINPGTYRNLEVDTAGHSWKMVIAPLKPKSS